LAGAIPVRVGDDSLEELVCGLIILPMAATISADHWDEPMPILL
jgi:hypothetical protein